MIDRHSPPLIRVIRAHERMPERTHCPAVGSSDLPAAWVSRLRIFGSLESAGECAGGKLRRLPAGPPDFDGECPTGAPSDSGLGSGFRHAPRTRTSALDRAESRFYASGPRMESPKRTRWKKKRRFLFYSCTNKANSLIHWPLKLSAKKSHSHT